MFYTQVMIPKRYRSSALIRCSSIPVRLVENNRSCGDDFQSRAVCDELLFYIFAVQVESRVFQSLIHKPIGIFVHSCMCKCDITFVQFMPFPNYVYGSSISHCC